MQLQTALAFESPEQIFARVFHEYRPRTPLVEVRLIFKRYANARRGASTREAKEVCRGCVVREDCLEFALDNGEKFGIWGGMSERERRRLRRARAIERRAQAS